MAEYILHCFAQSGNAYKPALMLAVSGADWEPRFVDFFHGATRTPEYRALNVMGEVPLLEHRGRIWSQSGVILDYLAEALGTYGPQDNDERREILRWTLFDNHKFTSYTATLRYLRNFVPTTDPAIIEQGVLRLKEKLHSTVDNFTFFCLFCLIFEGQNKVLEN